MCPAFQRPSWIPTRLIDLGTRGADTPPHIILTDGLPSQAFPYVAFSYLPNDDEHQGLCEFNLDDMLTAISLEDLPVIFRRAFNIASELQYRYVWIDALCVIRESDEDMLKEVPMMGKVFQHCDLNVTATSADSLLACTSKFDLGGSRNRATFLKLSSRQSRIPWLYQAVPQDVWCDAVVQSPLARYAGYFQDQFFSPRKLHFVGKQVFWECGTLKACEAFPRGLPAQLLQDPLNDNVAEKALRLARMPSEWMMRSRKQKLPAEVAVSWIEVWHQIVGLYSQCIQLDSSAKLPGISSIASEISTLGQDKYVAGMWRSNLINDLLWYIDGTPSHRPDDYRAPSWSWASVEGTIHHLTNLNTCRNFATVLDAHIFLADPAIPTGKVTGGFVILRGFLIKIPAPKFSYIRGPLTAGCFYPDDRDGITDEHYFCLPLRLQPSAFGDYLCGLVLRQKSEPWGLVYERVGMFRCLRGDSLHILGQKKYGLDAYVVSEELENVVDSRPFASDVTIV